MEAMQALLSSIHDAVSYDPNPDWRQSLLDGFDAVEAERRQFRVPSVDGNTLAMRVTEEGIIIDLEDESGEVIRTAYQFWDDLEEMTRRGE